MGNTLLTSEQLIAAYCQGFFPMAEHRKGEIGWFKPEERAILRFENLRISRSLSKVVRSEKYTITINHAFPRVIAACARLRDETWISHEIERAYTELHILGFAHSIEAWYEGELAGGLYGVAINGAFFGESMFHLQTDASKVSLVYLVRHLEERGCSLLDCQYINPHMESLGASVIGADEYDALLKDALNLPVSFLDSTPSIRFRPEQSE